MDLYSDPANQMDLGNHIGRHTPEYHQSIRDRLDSAYEDIAGQGQEPARRALKEVYDGIEKDIGSGALRPYRSKDVWVP